jgi:hypothetical protein
VEDVPDARYLPRNIPLDALLKVLVEEHAVMSEGLRRMKEAAHRGDLDSVSRTLKQLDPVFRQHIADEEGQILRLLIQELGRRDAEEEIKVFQQHRPIYRMMQTVSELASREPAELEAEQAKLNALFEEHTRSEEKRVFPRALGCYRQRSV